MAGNNITGVRRLELPVPGAIYESALVLVLPPPVIEFIECLRQTFKVKAPPEFQLIPHITVLFLGQMSSNQLLILQQNFSRLYPVRIPIELVDFGTFNRNEKVVNIHLKLKNDAPLREIHLQALEICRACGWMPQTRFLGKGYVPHISVLDRIEVDLTQLELSKKLIDHCGTIILDDLTMYFKGVSNLSH